MPQSPNHGGNPGASKQPVTVTKAQPEYFDRMFGKTSGAWYKKGVDLYYKQGKFQDAIHCFDRVIETEPDHAGAWNGRGICLKELGRYEEAIQCFDKVISLTPNDEEVYYNKGEALEKLGKALGDTNSLKRR